MVIRAGVWKILIYVFGIYVQCIHGSIILREYVEEACYGNSFIDFLAPNCTSDSVLYIHDVYTYAKPLTSKCPETATIFYRNDDRCCHYVNMTDDCGERYYGPTTEKEKHYAACIGMSECAGVQVAWNYTLFCDQSLYMRRTNYMRQLYNCIPKNSIAEICSSCSMTGNPLYVWNDGYPYIGSSCSTNSGCTCTVQASLGSSIQIDALDLRFTSVNSSHCEQRLHITDGQTESDISCLNNNRYARQTVYTSVTDNIEIRLDDIGTSSKALFWIMLQAVDPASELTINCSKKAVVHQCGDTFSLSVNTLVNQTNGTGHQSTISTELSSLPTTVVHTTVTTQPSTRYTDTTATTTRVTTKTTPDSSKMTGMTATSYSTSSVTSKVTTAVNTVTYKTYRSLGSTDPTRPSNQNISTTFPVPSTTLKSTTPANTAVNNEDNDSSIGGIAVAIIIIILALLGAIIGYVIYRKKKRGQVDISQQEEDPIFGSNPGFFINVPPSKPMRIKAEKFPNNTLPDIYHSYKKYST